MAELALSAPRPVSSSRLLVGLAGALAAVLALLAAGTWVEVARSGNTHAANDAALRNAALGVANQVVVDYTSLDYRNLTQQFQNVANLGDAAFKNAFLTQTNSAAELIVKAKATSKGTVDQLAVQNLTSTSADVLVAASQAIKNTSYPQGQVVYFRFDVKLVRQHGKWLVDAVNKV